VPQWLQRRGVEFLAFCQSRQFALAIVVVGLAFLIQNMVGGGGDDTVSPADTVATAAALNKTRTAQAGGGEQTQAPGQTTTQVAGSRTPGTPASTGTRPAGTQTPGAGAKTYTVKSGDFCGTIASENGVSLQALLDANNMTEGDCSSLQVGQILKLP
jgi:LysM repeat protein